MDPWSWLLRKAAGDNLFRFKLVFLNSAATLQPLPSEPPRVPLGVTSG